ncbi:MAG: cysteine peptidase family C39 domain-containing protein [Rectinemataceae bacterium]
MPKDAQSLSFSIVPKQTKPDSCGVAVLTGMLSLRKGGGPDETALLASDPGLGAAADGGISLADMLDALAVQGIRSAAFRTDYEGLREAIARYGPVALHLEEPRAHFVLALAADGEAVVVADPAEGLLALERSLLELRWSGALLAMEPDTSISTFQAAAGIMSRRDMLAAEVSGISLATGDADNPDASAVSGKAEAPGQNRRAAWQFELKFLSEEGRIGGDRSIDGTPCEMEVSNWPHFRLDAEFDPSAYGSVHAMVDTDTAWWSGGATAFGIGLEWRPFAGRPPGPAVGLDLVSPPFAWRSSVEAGNEETGWRVGTNLRGFGIEDPFAWSCSLACSARIPDMQNFGALLEVSLLYAATPSIAFAGSLHMEFPGPGMVRKTGVSGMPCKTWASLELRRSGAHYSCGIETGMQILGGRENPGKIAVFLTMSG